MSIQENSDRSHPRHLEAELVSHVRVIDDGISALKFGAFSPLALEGIRRALAGVRGAGVMLGNNDFVSVAGVLLDSINLVASLDIGSREAALRHLQAISEALRSLIVAYSEGSDPRPFLTATWANAQALQEMRLEDQIDTSADPLSLGKGGASSAASVGQAFASECAHHISLIRGAAGRILRDDSIGVEVEAVLRSLHALKGAASIGGNSSIRESCHRSEERILKLASSRPMSISTLVAEIRLAADSIEELLPDIETQPGLAIHARDSHSGIDHSSVVEMTHALLRSAIVLLEERATDSNPGTTPLLTHAFSDTRFVLERLISALRSESGTASEPSIEICTWAVLAARLKAAFSVMADDTGKPVELELQGLQEDISDALTAVLYDSLLQLLRNALDHGIESARERNSLGKPERGTVLVRSFKRGTSTVVEVFDDGAGIRIDRIREHGQSLGIDLEDLDDQATTRLIFEPGFTLRDTADARSGRGIGLDIVRTAVEELGGEVAVASTPGIGTCFRMTFPESTLRARTLLLRDEDAASNSKSHSRTALVVDDSVGVRRVLGRTLQRNGWRTVQARDGAEAIQVLNAELPDILVTDIEMPALDGYALVRAVRSHPDWSNLPIVVMTSRISDVRNDALLVSGADACLAKPFDEPGLLGALDLATHRRAKSTAA